MTECLFSHLFANPASVIQGGDTAITGLALDSRKVSPGDLYFALPGQTVNGLEFVNQAIAQGAVAVAFDSGQTPVETITVPHIKVPQLGQRLGGLASQFYAAPSSKLDMIGVTGTNGKTSVAHFISQVLTKADTRCGFIGTLGTGFGNDLVATGFTTPDAVQLQQTLVAMLSDNAQAVSMEVSSHALDQGRVNGIQFNTAVYTNLTRDHLDYHGTMAKYAAIKRKLIDWPGLRNAVLNADDPYGVELVEDFGRKLDCVAYSVNGPIAGVENLLAKDLQIESDGMSMTVEAFGERASLTSTLVGTFNAQNLLAVIGVMLFRGFTLSQACDAASTLLPVPGRMERVGQFNDFSVVVDYAHTPDALLKALQACRSHTEKRLFCVFGCGGDRDKSKRGPMGEIAERYADIVVVTNDNPRSEAPEMIADQICRGMDQPNEALRILDRRMAINEAIEMARPGDCVLIAGKGHESLQMIGEQSLPFNDAVVVREIAGVAA